MIRRLILAALLLGIAGCTTYGTPYYGGDYGYYDGYGYDRGYYADDGAGHYDGYGAYPYDYDDYYGGYGYSPYYGYRYSPWGLGRYSCGWYHGCAPYGGFSISIGYWSGAPWGWYGASWYPYVAYPYYAYPYYYSPYHHYGWHRPHDHDHDGHDRDDRRVHKPMVEEEGYTGSGVRSAPGEYLWPTPSRGGSRPTAVPQAPISGPSTPMAKPRPGLRAPPRDGAVGRRHAEPSSGQAAGRPYAIDPRQDPRYSRARYAEPAGAVPPSRPQPQRRYEVPAERPQPRYEAMRERPQPRYEAPAERPRPMSYESPREQPQPRYEAPSRESRPSMERPAVRESRSPSQNDEQGVER